MDVLVACEYSGRVREAFRRLGHNAYSCDLLDATDHSPRHFKADAIAILYAHEWDLVIAHPPCTFLANSGAKHLYLGTRKENGINPDRWANMQAGVVFFNRFKTWQQERPGRRLVRENPIMHGHAARQVDPYSCIIHPWQHGHLETKATCLWLDGDGMPATIVPTNDVYDEMMRLSLKERSRIHHAPPHPDRWKLRSATFPGIATALAQQLGGIA